MREATGQRPPAAAPAADWPGARDGSAGNLPRRHSPHPLRLPPCLAERRLTDSLQRGHLQQQPLRASGAASPGHTGPPLRDRTHRARLRPTPDRQTAGAALCGGGADAEVRRLRAGGRGAVCARRAGRGAARAFGPQLHGAEPVGRAAIHNHQCMSPGGAGVMAGLLPLWARHNSIHWLVMYSRWWVVGRHEERSFRAGRGDGPEARSPAGSYGCGAQGSIGDSRCCRCLFRLVLPVRSAAPAATGALRR